MAQASPLVLLQAFARMVLQRCPHAKFETDRREDCRA